MLPPALARWLLVVVPSTLFGWSMYARFHLDRLDLTTSVVLSDMATGAPLLCGVLLALTALVARDALPDVPWPLVFWLLVVGSLFGHCFWALPTP